MPGRALASSCNGKTSRSAAPLLAISLRLRQKTRLEAPMPSHKFHIGDSVMLKPAISRNVPGGVYEVIKQLPHNGREYEYRIKSANEEYERIAGERELTKV
jgi:hypothetical protein